MAYLPDEPDIRYLSREFLLSVLFFGAREKYLKLYEIYKDIQLQKSMTGNRKFFAKNYSWGAWPFKKFQPCEPVSEYDFYILIIHNNIINSNKYTNK